jgi:hypothetical protein
MRAASAFTLQKPCQSKKANDLNAVQYPPGSGQQDIGAAAATTTRQILPLWDSW